MARDVYVSYANQDNRTAHQVVDALEHNGVRCWIAPRDILPGSDWPSAISDGLSRCQVVLFILSEAANQSQFVARELTLALHQGLPILCYRLDSVRPRGDLAYLIADRQWIDASESGMAKLVSTAKEMLVRGEVSLFPATAEEAPPKRGSWLRNALRFFRLLPSNRAVPDPAAKDETADQEAERERVVAAQVVTQLICRRLEDLGKVVVPRSLREDLTSVIVYLPAHLDRVARQAGQVLSLKDHGRRLDTTELALRNLAALQGELAVISGPIARAVADVVANWIGLISAARTEAQAALEQAREIENPFIFGNPVHSYDAGLFTGRQDIVLEIERSIVRGAQAPTLLLYGQRRMGKTSILNQLPNLLGPDFLPVLIDCQAPATVESQPALLRHISRCLSNSLNLRLGITHEDEETRIRHGSLPIPLNAMQNDAFSIFEDWMDAFQSRLSKDTQVLLCLDEFERLQEIIQAGWGTRFLDALRHWIQHRPGFALMFVGSHTFEQLGPKWTDRFLSARRLKVSYLGADDVRRLLTQPTPTFNLAYAPGALEAILEVTNGQPFLTQVLASELVHHMNRTRSRQATLADVRSATLNALECSAEYFADLWFSRTEDERNILRDVARGQHHPPTTVLARGLRDYDLLNNDGEFAVPMVGQWVREHKL